MAVRFWALDFFRNPDAQQTRSVRAPEPGKAENFANLWNCQVSNAGNCAALFSQDGTAGFYKTKILLHKSCSSKRSDALAACKESCLCFAPACWRTKRAAERSPFQSGKSESHRTAGASSRVHPAAERRKLPARWNTLRVREGTHFVCSRVQRVYRTENFFKAEN